MKLYCLPAVAMLFASCGDKEPSPTPAPALTGGKGGTAVLQVYPQHHGQPIDSCTIYIKYATNDLPAGSYDDSARCVVVGSAGMATISGLKTGNYYLFGLGYDPAFGVAVDGGVPYNISQEDTFEVYLPVGEE